MDGVIPLDYLFGVNDTSLELVTARYPHTTRDPTFPDTLTQSLRGLVGVP